MRILLDTNILILREDNKIIPQEIQTLLKILEKIKAEILIHPMSVRELEKDKKENRREIILSKIKLYQQLESPPEFLEDKIFRSKITEGNEHEKIDNNILYAVYKDAVDFLITEDKGIHKKGSNIGIKERVLLIDDALQMFEKTTTVSKPVFPPALKEIEVCNLNRSDPIFDKLKQNYPEFSEWISRISREGRKCWVNYKTDKSIGALLIYKIEDEPIEGTPPLPKKKRFKISTFVVGNVGQKIGELFIKLSIDYCVKNDLTEIYLTHFQEPDDRLEQLITEYGFKKVSVSKRGENIFLKRLLATPSEIKGYSPIQILKEFYPSFYDGSQVKKYVIPIRSDYFDQLFTDYTPRQIEIKESSDKFIVEGNTIKKAYLTHSKITKLQQGDILLFYRSKRGSEITSIGVVESIHTRLTNPDEIIKIVGKRTVYSVDGIRKIARKPTTVILFYHVFHLPNPITYQNLKEMGVLSGPPQSICEVGDKGYQKIIRRSGIDEHFTIH